MDASNATRFLKSYNNIEEVLRSRYNVKASQSFTDLVNRCSDIDLTVRRYKDELVDYGKLRNAIVHKSMGDKIIAIPCDEVVETIEQIEKQVCHPPLILEILKPKKIAFVTETSTLKQALELFTRTKHGSIPVYGKNGLLGVLNSHGILKHIAEAMAENSDMNAYLETVTCDQLTDDEQLGREYKFLPKDATIFDSFRAFEAGKKTLAVIFTETGAYNEPVLNMLTSSDLPLLNKFMETF